MRHAWGVGPEDKDAGPGFGHADVQECDDAGELEFDLAARVSQRMMTVARENSQPTSFEVAASLANGADKKEHLAKTVITLLEQKLQNRKLQDELPTELLRRCGLFDRVCTRFFDDLEVNYFQYQMSVTDWRLHLSMSSLLMVCVIYQLCQEVVQGLLIPLSAVRYVSVLANGALWWIMSFCIPRSQRHERSRIGCVQRLLNFLVLQLVLWAGFTWPRLCHLSEGLSLPAEVIDGRIQDEDSFNLFCISIVIYSYSFLFQPSLDFLLVLVHFEPVYYVMVSFVLGTELNAAQVSERAILLYLVGLTAFIGARRNSILHRKSYLHWKLNDTKNRWNRQEIKDMKTVMGQMQRKTALMANNMADFLMVQQHKQHLEKLRAEMENSAVKKKIIRQHSNLVTQYLSLAKEGSRLGRLDRMEQVMRIDTGFRELTHMAEEESRRLADIMGQSYDVLEKLPDWNAVRSVPSFEKGSRPPEKSHQSSMCEWWGRPTGTGDWWQIFESEESVSGLARDRIQWFASRSQWARAPFVSELSKSVKTFNEANTARDLGLVPDEIRERWNRENPSKMMSDNPFPAEASLFSDDFEMAAWLKSEYLVHGKHAALQIGPNKDRARAEAKLEELEGRAGQENAKYPSEIKEKYICDWLRARVVFAHPMSLVCFFWFLLYEQPHLKCLTSKNKLMMRPSEDTSVSIQLNVGIQVQGEVHVAEVQLILEQFLCAKDLEHKYYELRRAMKLCEILSPVFPPDTEAVDEERQIVKEKSLKVGELQPPVLPGLLQHPYQSS